MTLTIGVSGIIKRSQPRLNISTTTRCPIVDINSSCLPMILGIISKFSIAGITISCVSTKFIWNSCVLSFCSSNTLNTLSALNTLSTLSTLSTLNALNALSTLNALNTLSTLISYSIEL